MNFPHCLFSICSILQSFRGQHVSANGHTWRESIVRRSSVEAVPRQPESDWDIGARQQFTYTGRGPISAGPSAAPATGRQSVGVQLLVAVAVALDHRPSERQRCVAFGRWPRQNSDGRRHSRPSNGRSCGPAPSERNIIATTATRSGRQHPDAGRGRDRVRSVGGQRTAHAASD